MDLKKNTQKSLFTIEDKQPIRKSQDLCNILFVGYRQNASGYYRMMVPYKTLPDQKEYDTHSIGLTKEDFNEPFVLPANLAIHQWASWADYIVFPIVVQPLAHIFRILRELHPDVQLVIDVDLPLHHIPGDDPLATKLSKKKLRIFEENLLLCDMVVFSSNALFKAYHYLLTTRFELGLPILEVVSDWLPKNLCTIATKTPPLKDAPIRIGMIVTLRNALDMAILQPVLESIAATYTKRVQWVVFGWDGILADGSEPFANLSVEYHASVCFEEYIIQLQNLSLDLALLPLRKIAYHRLHGSRILLELASLGIPVLTSAHSAYGYLFIETPELLVHSVEEWKKAISQLIENKALRIKLGEQLRLSVQWCHYQEEGIFQI